MQKTKLLLLFLLVLSLPSGWGKINSTNSTDGFSHILVKESHVQHTPKGSSIEATIDGHFLSVVFLENLGQVAVEVTTVNGYEVETVSLSTPNGVMIYIPNTGSYIVTFTLPNGDEYYGEFEVTD